MEVVVLNSEIARLVFGYLQHQRLNRAAEVFCKTSPYLLQEFCAFEHGLQTYSFLPQLEEIIREFVKIKSSVENVVASLPDNSMHYPTNLSDKIIYLLERNNKGADNSNAARSGSGDTVNEEKVNGITQVKAFSERKLKRGLETQHICYCDGERKSPAATAAATTSPSSIQTHICNAKRRRVLEPFCFLSTKRTKLNSQLKLTNSYLTINDDDDDITRYDDHDGDDSDVDSITSGNNDADEEEVDNECGEDFTAMSKPTKESTPRPKITTKTKNTPTISLPEILQVLLENPEFQLKLVENINQVLNVSNTSNCNQSSIAPTAEQVPEEPVITDEQKIVSSNQLLDQMVLDILNATASDPTFDKIIEDVIGSSNNCVSAGVQCNMDMTPATSELVKYVPETNVDTVEVALNPITMAPRTPLFIRNRQITTTTATSMVSDGDGHANDVPHHMPNSSFGSLIDPNFSISKLIVVNSNESAQKQQTVDSNLSNSSTTSATATDLLINQIANSNDYQSLDDQVCFDASTGQLTFPLYLTNDGLLANFPFLINNEMLTQQLQPENMANLDVSRIEIPLSEPIVVSADQLPPNAIILGSNQKSITDEPQQQPHDQQTLKKQAVKSIDDSNGEQQHRPAPAPSSLDSRIIQDRATPSANGIQNMKTYRSLSTPRRRAPHVRTLTFSPRSSLNPLSLPGATPLSTRKTAMSRLRRVPVLNTKPAGSSKPIIKKVEILPSLSAGVLETSTNESSNSCSIPQFFAGDEASNQTVISRDVTTLGNNKPINVDSDVAGVDTAAVEPSSESCTPKRKQLRHTAVRACKRQLSKSSNDSSEGQVVEEKKPTTGEKVIIKSTLQMQKKSKTKNTLTQATAIKSPQKLTSKPLKNQCKKRVQSFKMDNSSQVSQPQNNEKDSNAKIIDEWQRIRSSTAHDLDSRLREINSQMGNLKSRRVIKRKPRRRHLLAMKSKEVARQKSNDTTTNGDAAFEIDSLDRSLSVQSASTNESFVEQTADEKAAANKESKKECMNTTGAATAFAAIKVNVVVPRHEKNSVFVNDRDEQKSEFGVKIATPHKQSEKVDEPLPTPMVSTSMIGGEANERQKRTANIACLLETPFKEHKIDQPEMVPPTPGIFAAAVNTPNSKVCSEDHTLHSTSFLFGSLTKSEQGTPILSAITPGMRFTPFIATDGTPRSKAIEYTSGGGSYYKPDESDNLDHNIDKLLRDSGQKNSISDDEEQSVEVAARKASISTKLQLNNGSAANAIRLDEDMAEVWVEIPVETLKVEPCVLNRIKSFGSDGNESGNPLHIDPHYTLASGLPDICMEEVESSSSSASSTSSSSSNSSTSSSSSSPSPSNLMKKNSHIDRNTVDADNSADNNSAVKKTLSLENLSDISSLDDNEWQRLVTVQDADNSELINDDGEVRYPVRSWLTPCKNQGDCATAAVATMDSSAQPAMIKVTLPLNSVDKRNTRNEELEQKRLRMKEKLRLDDESKAVPHLTRAKKATSMRPKKQTSNAMALATQCPPTATKEKDVQAQKQHRSLEVLTALNLSARKRIQQQSPAVTASKPITSSKIPLPGESDDNAVSIVFSAPASNNEDVSTQISSTPSTRKVQIPSFTKLLSLAKGKSTTMTKSQRKCMQIDARVVQPPTSKRSSVKQPKRLVPVLPKLSVMPKIQVKSNEPPVSRVSPRLKSLRKQDNKKRQSPARGNDTKTPLAERSAKGKGSIVEKLSRGSKRDRIKKELKAAEGLVDLACNEICFPIKDNTKTTATTTINAIQAKFKNTLNEGEIEEMVPQQQPSPLPNKKKAAKNQLKTDLKSLVEKPIKVKDLDMKSDCTTLIFETEPTLPIKPPMPQPPSLQSISQLPLNAAQILLPASTQLSPAQPPIPTSLTTSQLQLPTTLSSSPKVKNMNLNVERNFRIDDEIYEDEYDGDDLVLFDMKTITEDDEKHYISHVHNEISNALPTQQQSSSANTSKSSRIALDEFKMVVAFDDGEKYNLCFTDEICLYSNEAKVSKVNSDTIAKSGGFSQSIRNIPKKRLVRITTMEKNEIQINNIISNPNEQQNSQPNAISTPLFKTATTSSVDNAFISGKSITHSLPPNNVGGQEVQQQKFACKGAKKIGYNQMTSDATATNVADNIQIGDIESILSHLHPSTSN